MAEEKTEETLEEIRDCLQAQQVLVSQVVFDVVKYFNERLDTIDGRLAALEEPKPDPDPVVTTPGIWISQGEIEQLPTK